jgi:septum formation protein
MIRLASNSQTRAEILKKHGLEFIQDGCDFDEDKIVAKTPKEFVYKATLGKYHECYEKFGLELPLLVADTVVTSEGKILRKAKDRDDAKRILELQSGNITTIITCMIYEEKGIYLLDIASTDYLFEKFDEDDLTYYLNSGEWQGKAGACMVEGFCKKYIKEVRGLESTAMGLAIERVLPFMKSLDV